MSEGYWLYQRGDFAAHAYRDDDDDTTALCGHRLNEEGCHYCGQELRVTGASPARTRCQACVAKLTTIASRIGET